jgi:glycosyltransferase involved in cell wall biosynthesis
MKIALLHAYDTRDKRAWSGIAYYMACALTNYCGEIFHLSPIPFSKEKLIGRVINKSSRIFFRKNFRYHSSFLFAKRFAKVTAQRLAGQSFDVIVAPAGATEIAFLETATPIVFVEDSTYGLLFDYYPICSNLLRRSIYEMNVIQEQALAKASAVIYSSAWAARSAIEDYGADPAKIHVVPFGANIDEPPPGEVVLARTKSEQCRLLFLGVDWVRKGGDIAFETLLQLEELGVRAELIVCGCTPPERFAHERMKIIPFLDKNDEKQRQALERLLMSADFLLVPTRADCTPIVFCEASAFGLPVVTTNTGGVPEIVREGENGFLLPYEARGDAYAEVIARLYRDDERYAELVRASRAAFEERLNWDAWGVAVKHILANVLAQKSPIEIASSA